MNASFAREQVNQGKSTLTYRSSVSGLVASWDFFNLWVFGAFYLFVGVFCLFQTRFYF